MSYEGLKRYEGTLVRLKDRVPSDQRGRLVAAGTVLRVSKVIDQHMWLVWPEDGKPAVRDGIHYSKLVTA